MAHVAFGPVVRRYMMVKGLWFRKLLMVRQLRSRDGEGTGSQDLLQGHTSSDLIQVPSPGNSATTWQSSLQYMRFAESC